MCEEGPLFFLKENRGVVDIKEWETPSGQKYFWIYLSKIPCELISEAHTYLGFQKTKQHLVQS